MQITKVVDSYDGKDPFKGDGYIAKGRVLSKLLGKQPDVTREIVIEQSVKAMTAYRSTILQCLHLPWSLFVLVLCLTQCKQALCCIQDHMLS